MDSLPQSLAQKKKRWKHYSFQSPYQQSSFPTWFTKVTGSIWSPTYYCIHRHLFMENHSINEQESSITIVGFPALNNAMKNDFHSMLYFDWCVRVRWTRFHQIVGEGQRLFWLEQKLPPLRFVCSPDSMFRLNYYILNADPEWILLLLYCVDVPRHPGN